jgi:hypothetical protein
MDCLERIATALQGQEPDRVPVIAPLGLSYLRQLLGPGPLFDRFVEDPLGTIIKVQEDLGLDPVIYTYSELEGESKRNWRSRGQATKTSSAVSSLQKGYYRLAIARRRVANGSWSTPSRRKRILISWAVVQTLLF